MEVARRHLGLALVVAMGAVLAGAARHDSASAGSQAAYRILLVSNRDGRPRGYSVRPDGSRLTPLLARRTLVPATLSGDGSTIAYQLQGRSGIYVSRADGSRLRQVVRGPASEPALSRDGSALAFTTKKPGIWIVGADGRRKTRLTRGPDSAPAWSPDGKALAFIRSKGDVGVLVVRRLHGTGRVVTWGDFYGFDWSPDGRRIAYLSNDGLWVVQRNGGRRHLLARRTDGFAWSPDGKRLVLVQGGDVTVIGLDGRGRRLGLRDRSVSGVAWLPDGRLALDAFGQIWIVGHDGRGLLRVTSAGANHFVGWTRLAPILPSAPPVPKTERAVGRRSLVLRARVTDIAADGGRVAFITGPTPTDCDHVAVWTPATKAIRRALPAPCGQPHEYVDGLGSVALAGARVAWHSTGCCGNYEETRVITATLARMDPPWVYVAEDAEGRGNGLGGRVEGPVGSGSVLAFTQQQNCDSNAGPKEKDACPPGLTSGDVLATTVWRFSGRSRTAVYKVGTQLSLLAVDAGRLVVGTESGVRLLTVRGRVLRTFDVSARAAALSGNRLAVEDADGIEVYDVSSGRRAAAFPDLSRLQDLEGDILVAAPAKRVIVRKLGTGRTLTIRTSTRAELERPGLFVAGARRITFTPMSEVLRRLGG